jgi:hypothetical protein
MQSIEVFKTNINCPSKAQQLADLIDTTFAGCKANFDLDDCDNILRVVFASGSIASLQFINWLKNYECVAEILPDH